MIGNDWDIVLAQEYRKDYYTNIQSFLKEEYLNKTI